MLIFIVGKTGTGKDTVTKYITSKYGIKQLVSYTTRPMRKADIEGVTHYFIDDAKMDRLWDSPNVIARTDFDNGIRALGMLENKTAKNMVYIIDPNGIAWYKEHSKLQEEFVSIYLNLSEDKIRERAAARGDDPEILEKRINAESKLFDDFYSARSYDYCIDTEQSKDEVFAEIDGIMKELQIAED